MYMNKKIFIAVFIIFLFVFSFNFVFADTPGDTGGGGLSLKNPLGSNTDPRDIIGNVIKAILGIVGSLALLSFIFGGFLWVTSAGNEEKIKKGKDIILWSSLGLAIIFLSYAMVNFVIKAITSGSS